MKQGLRGRWFVGSLAISILCIATAARAQGRNEVKAGELHVDPPTLHCLGFRWMVEGDSNGNARGEVTYRKSGEGEWQRAQPMLRVNREETDKAFRSYRASNLLAGSVLNLEPNTEYE